jgi:signal peptide peptidase SppA
MTLSETMQALTDAILAMHPRALRAVVERAADGDQAAETWEPTYVSAVHRVHDPNVLSALRLPAVKAQVGIIPIRGVLAQRASAEYGFADTSTERVGRVFDEMMASPAIGAIVLDIDSPGGVVAGTPELADKVFRARGAKPVYALANSEAASAAYWLGSQADRLFVTPSGAVGSIGVWTMHQDVSKYMEAEGVKVTVVSAGKYKTEAHPWGELAEEAMAEMQRAVDGYYGQFVDAVARGRGVKASAVRSGFGEGRMVRGKEAVTAGMADGVATLDEVLGAMLRPAARPGANATIARLTAEIEACDV